MKIPFICLAPYSIQNCFHHGRASVVSTCFVIALFDVFLYWIDSCSFFCLLLFFYKYFFLYNVLCHASTHGELIDFRCASFFFRIQIKVKSAVCVFIFCSSHFVYFGIMFNQCASSRILARRWNAIKIILLYIFPSPDLTAILSYYVVEMIWAQDLALNQTYTEPKKKDLYGFFGFTYNLSPSDLFEFNAYRSFGWYIFEVK